MYSPLTVPSTPHGAGAPLVEAVTGLRATFPVPSIARQHDGALLHVSYTEKQPFRKLLQPNDLVMVEAAGVEPASEIGVNKETPCSVTS
jgi:hypothetical protein